MGYTIQIYGKAGRAIILSSAVMYDFIGFILLLVTAATIIQYSKHRNEANLTRLPICVDINNPADMPNFVYTNNCIN